MGLNGIVLILALLCYLGLSPAALLSKVCGPILLFKMLGYLLPTNTLLSSTDLWLSFSARYAEQTTDKAACMAEIRISTLKPIYFIRPS